MPNCKSANAGHISSQRKRLLNTPVPFWSLLLCSYSASLNLKFNRCPVKLRLYQSLLNWTFKIPTRISTFLKKCYFESACTPFVGEFKMRGGKRSFKNSQTFTSLACSLVFIFLLLCASRSLDFFTKLSQSFYNCKAEKATIEVPI